MALPTVRHPNKAFFNKAHWRKWYSEKKRLERWERGGSHGTAVPYKIGDKFRNWTIISQGSTSAKVNVKCRCGFEGERFLTSVRRGPATTCHKCRTRSENKHKLRELAESYGDLTPIRQQLGAKTSPNIYCRCVCDKELWVSYTNLNTGRKVSCGCGGEEPWGDGDSFVEKVSIGGKIYNLTVDSSKPRQPKSEANKKRMEGLCNLHGLCENFVKCGDADFLGECLGPSFKNLDVACPDAY
jgi:hypothetical protein